MTTEDPIDTSPEETDRRARRGGRLWHVLAGFGAVFIGGSLLLWLARKPVAEQALAAWCAEHDLECDANFTELGTEGITLSALKVASGDLVPAEAEEVRAELRWKGLFTPEVTGVTVNGLSLRGTVDAAGIHFGGLERLAQTGGGGGTAPPIDIRNARLFLDTPLGPAAATVNIAGTFPQAGTVSVTIDPGMLGTTITGLKVQEGRLDVRGENGLYEAELGLKIEDAEGFDTSLKGFDLMARAEFGLAETAPAALEWSLRAADFVAPGMAINGMTTTGQMQFASRPGAAPAEFLSALASGDVQAGAAKLSVAGREVTELRLEGELTGADRGASGPLTLTTGRVTAPEGEADGLVLAGEVRGEEAGGISFDGALSVSGASLSEDIRKQAGAAFSLPGVLEGHVGSLRTALDKGLSGFDATVGLGASAANKSLTLYGTGDSAVEANSGLSLRIRALEDQPWLTLSQDRISARGNIALSGGGSPSASLALREFDYTPSAMTLAADAFILRDWSVGGRMISAAVSDIRIEDRPGDLQFAARGDFGFAGEAGGVTFAPTRIRGGLDGARSSEGWRVQAMGAPCLAVDTDGLTLGAIAIQPARADICPVNGRFMRQGAIPSGAANLGTVSLPFTLDSGSGTLKLENASIDWTAGKGFEMTVAADTFSLPLTLGERTVTIDSAAPSIGIRTGEGPAAILAQLGETDFGGSMIPADVTARKFAFDGISAESGIEGAVTATGVLIRDLDTDPIYQPILADFAGTLSKNRLRLTGPLSLRASGIQIADAALDLDIVELNGTAQVVTHDIVFTERGLQPRMISDRLTGLFTRATGRVDGKADFTITDGSLAGTADAAIDGFGFQTTRLGRVSGFSGNIHFDDVMALTTPSGQSFRLASVDPGILLTNGNIQFSLKEGGLLALENVTFPFGGGSLSLEPFDWALEGGLEDMTVFVRADDIDLGQLIRILKLPDTSATGLVSGTFPIGFTENSIEIRKARLKAVDPGGQLSYTGGAVGTAADQDPNANLAFDALRDLQFSVLEVGIDGDLAGQVKADLLIAGRNNRPLPMGNKLTLPAGQAFEFAVSFDVPLGKLLEDSVSYLSQEQLIDAAQDLLDKEKDGQKADPKPKPE